MKKDVVMSALAVLAAMFAGAVITGAAAGWAVVKAVSRAVGG